MFIMLLTLLLYFLIIHSMLLFCILPSVKRLVVAGNNYALNKFNLVIIIIIIHLA